MRDVGVARVDDTEEQARLLSGQGLESRLVDDQQRGFQVFHPAQTLQGPVSVLFHGVQQVFQGVEGHGEAIFHRLDPQGDGKMRLARARRPLDEEGFVLPDVGAGGQPECFLPVDALLLAERLIGEQGADS